MSGGKKWLSSHGEKADGPVRDLQGLCTQNGKRNGIG
nr:MAG TPA: hypothetical protein [Bacteriophage sp.]